MPLPKPRKDEKKNDFIERCMSNENVRREFDDQEKRAGYCYNTWRRKDMESVFTITDYVNVSPGEPFRLLPFGKIVKGGEERNITPELAMKFKLPHFRPPIKIGTHKDDAPAGGHIKELFVRDDGLYAIPEYTEKGLKIMQDGDFKYQSPEIVWEGGFEDPKTGEIIEGPMIVGDALLHHPHLGEEAALYKYTHTKETNTMSDTVQVPTGLWEKYFAPLFQSPETEPEREQNVSEVNVEEFETIQSERDEYKSQLEAMEAEREREEMISSIQGEFGTDEFGAAYQDLAEDEDAVEMLAGMEEEQREWVLEKFRAYSKQIEESELIEEKGTGGKGIDEDNPREQLNALATERAKEKEISYAAALREIKEERPELVTEAYGGR